MLTIFALIAIFFFGIGLLFLIGMFQKFFFSLPFTREKAITLVFGSGSIPEKLQEDIYQEPIGRRTLYYFNWAFGVALYGYLAILLFRLFPKSPFEYLLEFATLILTHAN
jgi:hypothetical protein